jgi:hypothetical protein
MPADFHIEILEGNFEKIRRQSDKARMVITDMDAAWDAMHQWALRWQERVFKSQGGSIDQPWDYSTEPQYEEWKRDKTEASARHVMRWRGGNEVLYPSLTSASDPQHIWQVTGDSAVFGTDVDYASRLASPGTNLMGEPRPARPTLVMTKGHQIAVFEWMLRDLRERLNDAGVEINDPTGGS